MDGQAKMTRQSQKEAERHTLVALLSALDFVPDRIDDGEQPDFVLSAGGRTFGVEVTMYQSGTTVGASLGRRQVESEWEILQRSSRAFQVAQSDIARVNVGLMFRGAVPGRKEQQIFMEEIATFIRSHASEVGVQGRDFWPHQFTSPLMHKYLRTLQLREGEWAEWYSNISFGYVAIPDSTLTAIVSGKAGKTYKATSELWLVIQCSRRISETVLQLNGISDYEAAPGLTKAMQASPFSKVYVITLDGVFQWDKLSGWSNLAPETASPRQGATLDELQNTLADPEWLTDPEGRFDLEVRRVLQEFRDGKLS